MQSCWTQERFSTSLIEYTTLSINLTIFPPKPMQEDWLNDLVLWTLLQIVIFCIQYRQSNPCQTYFRWDFDAKPLCRPSWFVCRFPWILHFTHFKKKTPIYKNIYSHFSLLLPQLSISLEPYSLLFASALCSQCCCILFMTCISFMSSVLLVSVCFVGVVCLSCFR